MLEEKIGKFETKMKDVVECFNQAEAETQYFFNQIEKHINLFNVLTKKFENSFSELEKRQEMEIQLIKEEY